MKAHLFRKRCKHLPEKPFYVLGFRERKPFRFRNEARARAIQKRILEGEVTLPGPAIVLCTDGDNYRFGGSSGGERMEESPRCNSRSVVR